MYPSSGPTVALDPVTTVKGVSFAPPGSITTELATCKLSLLKPTPASKNLLLPVITTPVRSKVVKAVPSALKPCLTASITIVVAGSLATNHDRASVKVTGVVP